MRFMSNDLEDWLNATHRATLSAKSESHQPPGTEDLPTVVIPQWGKISAYICTGGLSNVDVNSGDSARGGQGAPPHSPADEAQGAPGALVRTLANSCALRGRRNGDATTRPVPAKISTTLP